MTTNEKALKMHEEWHGKIETTAKSHVCIPARICLLPTLLALRSPAKAIAKDKRLLIPIP